MSQLDRRKLLSSCPRFTSPFDLACGCLWLMIVAPASANDQTTLHFQPEFMRQPPGQANDSGGRALQALAAQAPLPPGRYDVELYVNLTYIERRQVLFQAAADGTLAPCLNAALLRATRLREQALEMPLPNDDRCLDLGALVPQATVDFDPARLRLSLSIPQIGLRRDNAGNIPPSRWDTGINAAFVNYQASVQQHRASQRGNQDSYDLYLNSGVNLGPWRLRSNQALRQAAHGQRDWKRSDSYAQRDLPDLRANITLGETFTRGDVFRSFAFTGAQLASDMDMLPDNEQRYAPIIRGVAQSRAKLEVLHNGYPIYSTYVAPGPYAIDDLSVGASHGELEVVLTEADGQVRRFVQPYSSLGNLLRDGVWRYSATAGRYNGAEHLDRPTFWQATAARGGIFNTTLYGGVLGSQYYRANAVGVARDFGELGALSFDLTHALTDLHGPGGKVQGQSFAARYGKSFQTRTNLRFAGYRYSTQGYRDFDEAIRERATDSSYLGNRRSRLEASIYQSIGQSALSLTLAQDDYWRNNAQRRYYQLQYTTRFSDLSVNLFASQALTSRHQESRMFGVSLSLPLGQSRRYHSTFDSHHSDGRSSQRASLGGHALNRQLSYQASLSNDPQNRQSTALSLAYEGKQASYGMGYTQGSDYRNISLNASGALLLHEEGIVLGPYLGETSALVHVPDVAGLGVQNTPSASTDAKGYLLVPNLRPYRLNSLTLDTDDLAPDILIDNGNQHLVPGRGAVVKATFAARQVQRMVLTLLHPDGRALPFGAQVSNQDGEPLAVVGQAGQTLVASDEPGRQQLHVQWGGAEAQDCQVTLTPQSMPKEGGYRLQTLTCQAEAPQTGPHPARHQENEA
ncbi:fimbria/pilus outer membrane usher protein [Pseudomonas sp. NBRC 111127]|uniref:fimbria/pilus outer membrane usher protein n=1 Tax=Pseudomonas sp. NBRC 111127 TaxID=1661042 RepID=UPI0006D41982|nr:fimbria/pilus outer membrane usher protein [Pseudomonas sp. NBRC 111127]